MDGADAGGIVERMRAMGRAAKAAARAAAQASAERKHAALIAMEEALLDRRPEILEANAGDLSAAADKGLSDAMLDRLRLDEARVRAMADGVRSIAEQRDPVGDVIAEWTQPNGLTIRRVRTPLGVIGVVYESRPNVTADAGALCLKAGNAAILRGGSESAASSRAIHACLVDGLRAAALPEAVIQRVDTTDRAAVGALLENMADLVDVVVPRGGRSLVERVQTTARVPVFAHLDGICHVYVHGDADLEMARAIVVNAKMRRTGICGAAETLLVDRSGADRLLAPIVSALIDAGCEVRGDPACQAANGRVIAASEDDFGHEFLAPVIAAKVVDGLDAAVAHIEAHGSGHTEAIVSESDATAADFLARLDSAILLHNASTQFADGGEFGMGAEIGIATGKLHARGPVGAEQLTSFKYVVTADGAIRS